MPKKISTSILKNKKTPEQRKLGGIGSVGDTMFNDNEKDVYTDSIFQSLINSNKDPIEDSLNRMTNLNKKLLTITHAINRRLNVISRFVTLQFIKKETNKAIKRFDSQSDINNLQLTNTRTVSNKSQAIETSLRGLSPIGILAGSSVPEKPARDLSKNIMEWIKADIQKRKSQKLLDMQHDLISGGKIPNNGNDFRKLQKLIQ